jgi:hypothetical protein
MLELSAEQHELIEKYFNTIMKWGEFQKEIDAREDNRRLATKILARDTLRAMTELEFGELISNLWASRIWGNKSYLIQKILAENDNNIERIRSQFENLLYGKGKFENLFDTFLDEVNGLGTASITEILCLYDPTRFGIWNTKARKALKVVKFIKLPLNKYQITGEEYTKINNALKSIEQKISTLGLHNVDLLAVDYFLYEIWNMKKDEIETEVELIPEPHEFKHDEIRDFIKEIGIQLGFEADIEQRIAHGARVDVIWRAKIANLGVVTYVFEVQLKGGSTDSAILNLQRAQANPTVQKVIIVSDREQLEKIKKETGSLPENFRKALSFWEVTDVVKTYEKLSDVIESINKLELVKSQFQEEMPE